MWFYKVCTVCIVSSLLKQQVSKFLQNSTHASGCKSTFDGRAGVSRAFISITDKQMQ